MIDTVERIDTDGTVHIRPFSLPLSIYLSDAARKAFIAQSFNPPALQEAARSMDIGVVRGAMDKHLFGPLFERAIERYPATIRQEFMAGVAVAIIEPSCGIAPHNERRVLINLHGGYFAVGAGLGGLVESVPLATLMQCKVISIDYRQGPEHQFPAASEDVAAVYRKLLEQYAPDHIGIYGCSAGGLLTAMAVAWFAHENLPLPGALAMLSAGASAVAAGDSGFSAHALMGQDAPPSDPNPPFMPIPYLFNTDRNDPLVSPLIAPELLAKFPAVLLLTGTRAFDCSTVIHTHRSLVEAGASAELQLWDGLWHCFFYDVDLPESLQAIAQVAKFFDKNLGGVAIFAKSD